MRDSTIYSGLGLAAAVVIGVMCLGQTPVPSPPILESEIEKVEESQSQLVRDLISEVEVTESPQSKGPLTPQRFPLHDEELREMYKAQEAKLAASLKREEELKKRVAQLERELLVIAAKKSMRRYTELTKLSEEQVLDRLADSELFPYPEGFHLAMQRMAPRDIEVVLKLEREFTLEYGRMGQEQKKLIGWDAQMAYQKATIDPWLAYRLKGLDGQLRGQGVPAPLIKQFIETHK